MLQKYITYKFIFIHLVLLVLVLRVNAQDVTVKAKLDTSEFLVGDQVELELEVKQPIKEFVGIPVFNQEENNQIEILEQSENDTTLLETGHYLIKKRILITAFDSGYYALPPIPFTYYTDTLRSEPIAFKVIAVPVDTTKAIMDIKMPYGAPLSFAEVFPWAGSGLALALIIFLIIYIIRKIRRKEPIIRRFRKIEPAHILAYRGLDKLKDDKLWQKDRVKDYYTVLTDVLRMYLWNRFSIRTLERTSEEILQSLKMSDFKDDDAYNTLKDIFYVSDLVKFAKYKPLLDDHERSMKGAYNFVDKTKLLEEETKEEEIVEEEVKYSEQEKVEDTKALEKETNS